MFCFSPSTLVLLSTCLRFLDSFKWDLCIVLLSNSQMISLLIVSLKNVLHIVVDFRHEICNLPLPSQRQHLLNAQLHNHAFRACGNRLVRRLHCSWFFSFLVWLNHLSNFGPVYDRVFHTHQCEGYKIPFIHITKTFLLIHSIPPPQSTPKLSIPRRILECASSICSSISYGCLDQQSYSWLLYCSTIQYPPVRWRISRTELPHSALCRRPNPWLSTYFSTINSDKKGNFIFFQILPSSLSLHNSLSTFLIPFF